MTESSSTNTNSNGQMSVRMYCEQSYHGISIRVLKSAIQKYARRAMYEKGIWCLIELDLFSLFETSEQACLDQKTNIDTSLTVVQILQNCVKIRSNVINRLVAMMSE
ncbi:unnamed protein product, partial [Didymodactylos carnosus]